jgi:hypothetical protein
LTPISKTVQRVFEFFSTQINDGHPHGLQQPHERAALSRRPIRQRSSGHVPMEKQHLAAAGAISKAAYGPDTSILGALFR